MTIGRDRDDNLRHHRRGDSSSDYARWCPSCQDVCLDHARICTVCGTPLQSALHQPEQPNNGEDRHVNSELLERAVVAANNGTIQRQRRSLLSDVQQASNRLREIVHQIQDQLDVATGQQVALATAVAQMREEWQIRNSNNNNDVIPAEWLDPSNTTRPAITTCPETLARLPRNTLRDTSALLQDATLQIHHPIVAGTTNTAGTTSIMQAIPGEFGPVTAMHWPHALLVVPSTTPRTGIHGQLPLTTLQAIAAAIAATTTTAASAAAVILYMERGDGVTFVQKAILAQQAGCHAVVIGNHILEPWPYVMRDSANEATDLNLQIPAIMIRQQDAAQLIVWSQQQKQQQQEQDASSFLTCSLHIAPASHDCVVCTEPMSLGQTVVRLPTCGHVFHEDCVIPWLSTHSNTCPYCRNALPVADPTNEQPQRQQRPTQGGDVQDWYG